MQPQTQNLITYITSLNLPPETKKSILARLQNEELTEELYNEIDTILQNELAQADAQLAELDAQILEKQGELQRTKEQNQPQKIALRDKHRAWLKEIFDEALITGKKLAGDIDQHHETQKVEGQEASEIEAIKAGLLSE